MKAINFITMILISAFLLKGCTEPIVKKSVSEASGKCIVDIYRLSSTDAKIDINSFKQQVGLEFFTIHSDDDVLTCDSYYASEGYCTAHKAGDFIVGLGLVPLHFRIKTDTPFRVSYNSNQLKITCPKMEAMGPKANEILEKISDPVVSISSEESYLIAQKLQAEITKGAEDKNSDGIRDDVETKINGLTSDEAARVYLRGFARESFRFYNSVTPEEASLIFENVDSYALCVFSAQENGKYITKTPTEDIVETMTNTAERRKKRQNAFNLMFKIRSSIQLPQPSEREAFCSQALSRNQAK